MKYHHYALTIKWTGNNGEGTIGYKTYERSLEVIVDGKEIIKGSSDPSFLGDKTKHNPEELFLASISSCHMLWYLHLCADAKVIVTNYVDYATATMVEMKNGAGKFEEVILNPLVTVKELSMKDTARLLHNKANEYCFIANALNFNIIHKATIIVV